MDEAKGILDRSRAYWTKRAPEYARFHEDECFGPVHRAYARAFSSLLDALSFWEEPRSTASALDLGCGSGFITLVLASLGFETASVDFSPSMVEQARATFEKAGVSSDVRVADIQNLGYPDASFDAVAMRNVTWIVPDVSAVYREALRVLKPGGVLINVDAAYGKSFAAAEASGAKPSHPTQTASQLEERNAITRELDVSHVDRPAWDVAELLKLDVRTLHCECGFASMLGEAGLKKETVSDGAGGTAALFAVCARKRGAAIDDPSARGALS